jgi:hypothetical protein
MDQVTNRMQEVSERLESAYDALDIFTMAQAALSVPISQGQFWWLPLQGLCSLMAKWMRTSIIPELDSELQQLRKEWGDTWIR